MYDLTAEFKKFYDTYVRLGPDLRKDLADKRDLNLGRLNDGLDLLAEEVGRARPHYQSYRNQGGYAMHTLNQDPREENGYDIDVAVIFNKDDLPEGALAARQRVRDALIKKCGSFADVPEARTNAVTIWYSEGYHIDFAVYRQSTDAYGTTKLEHASTSWKERNPSAVTDWFTRQVSQLSPKSAPAMGYYIKVGDGQFRRIVRFVKWYCKSRSGWSLPGGMVISSLLAESGIYKPDPNRDDRALYNTLVALRDRLESNTKVDSPIDGSDLTAKNELESQVKRLHKYLKRNIPKLDVLFKDGCKRDEARYAWDWIFNHPFWSDEEPKTVTKSVMETAAADSVGSYYVEIRCDLSHKAGGRPYAQYRSGSSLLRKGIELTFSVEKTNVLQPYDVTWTVQNEGDEAIEDNQETWSKTRSAMETSTKYKGNQKMLCQIYKNGRLVAQATHLVRIAGYFFGKSS